LRFRPVTISMNDEYAEYRCSACKKPIKSKVIRCKTCVAKLFYHPGCLNRHKVLDRNGEAVPCTGPFEEILIESSEETNMNSKKASTDNRDRDRAGSIGSAGSTGTVKASSSAVKTSGGASSIDFKIDWLIKIVKEIKDETVCKKEVKTVIKEVVREELSNIKQELEDLRKMIREGINRSTESGHSSYSEAVKKKKENIIIIKPKTQQESETTKEVIKEKVDIRNMSMGITKLRKGREGTVILGCETGDEMIKLKDAVQSKLGENYNVTDPLQMKPKIKIINISEEEMELEDDELIHTIKKQNSMEESRINIVKKILKKKNKDNSQSRSKGRDGGSIIIEADEQTHDMMLKKEKLNIGWRKCPVYNHISIKRCYKCWGYYHIAKNCTRDETCVNCMFKIKTYNLKISDEHDALSPECPTYKRAIEEEKRRAGWEVKKR